MAAPPQLFASIFHKVIDHEKCRAELLRHTLSSECLMEVDTNYDPLSLSTRVEGADGFRSEGDGDILLHLLSKRFSLISYEAKSYPDPKVVWQALSHGLRQALHVARRGGETGGKLPGLVIALAMHGKGAKTRIKSLADIARMTGEWRKVVVDIDLESIRVINFSDLSRKDLCDDPEAGGLLLLLVLSDGREIEREDFEYLAKAWALYPRDIRHYTNWCVIDTLGVPRLRWHSELLKVASPEEVETAMNALDEIRADFLAKGETKGRAEGLAEGFLIVAKQQFREVPGHLAVRVRNASAEQIRAWYEQLHDAHDLESVLNEGRNGRTRS